MIPQHADDAGPARVATDSELIERIAAGNRASWLELRLRYGTTAYAAAYRVLTDPERVEAVVARAFERVWREAARIGRIPASAARWLAELTQTEACRVTAPAAPRSWRRRIGR